MPGEYSNEVAQASCKICPKNTKSESAGSTECQVCGAGAKSDEGSAKCSKCDAGEAGTGTDGACEACQTGQYRNSGMVDSTTCVLCPGGSYQGDEGQASCLPCSPGEFQNNAGATKCELCAVSTYFGGKARNRTCINCPAGWSSGEGSTKCQSCEAGTFSNVKGAACQSCDIGQYRQSKKEDANGALTEESTDPTKCVDCPAGWSSEASSTKCQPCEAGSFSNEKGKACQSCDIGQYRQSKKEDVNGALTEESTDPTKCVDCPVGWSSEEGSTKCQSCEAGTFSNEKGKACQSCAVGQYRQSKKEDANGALTEESTDPTKCVDCPAGWSSEASSTKCQPCEAGSFSNEKGKACQSCDIGQYRQSKKEDANGDLTEESTDPTTCSDCPTGWTSEEGSTKCQACGAGMYGEGCKSCKLEFARKGNDIDATQCRRCNLGETTTILGAASCSKCDVGRYGSTAGVCSSCPAGQYQDGKGEHSCKECEADTYLEDTGKSSKADCKQCHAERSTGSFVGSTSAFACLCERADFYQLDDGECVVCPEGADCNQRDGVPLEDIVADVGSWRPDSSSVTFISCQDAYRGSQDGGKLFASQRCCPLNTTTNISSCQPFTNPNEQCLKGYIGPLCRGCEPLNYVHSGGGCIPCSGGSSISAGALSVVGGCSVFYFLMLLSLACNSSPPGNAKERDAARKKMKIRLATFGQIKLLLNFLQVLSSTTQTMSSVPWPANFRSFTTGIDFVNMDMMNAFVVSDCHLAVPPLDRFLLHMMVRSFDLLFWIP